MKSSQDKQSKQEVLSALAARQLVPVIVIDDANMADPLAEALINGGLPVAEVTLRTEAALDSIEKLSKYPELILGAGTVTKASQVDEVVARGANYVICPGIHDEVIKRCLELDILVIPGVITPSDIARAMEYGLEVVKFFPAEAFGGVKTLKAMAAPYHTMKFVPTGGINAANVADYLAVDAVVACGGSWMVDRKLMQSGDFAQLEEKVKEAVQLVKN